jgi:hypothetical protein
MRRGNPKFPRRLKAVIFNSQKIVLNVQIFHIESIIFDKLAARFNLIAH